MIRNCIGTESMKRSRPLVIALEARLREQHAKLFGQSKVGKAIAYTSPDASCSRASSTTAASCMSNNAAERESARSPWGARNWTFAGSDEGSHRAAEINTLTLTQTAKLDDVDPWAWLADVLARLQDCLAKPVHELLPWNCERHRPQMARRLGALSLHLSASQQKPHRNHCLRGPHRKRTNASRVTAVPRRCSLCVYGC
jgi:IS66 C-terminal element/Transposase IS66 family